MKQNLATVLGVPGGCASTSPAYQVQPAPLDASAARESMPQYWMSFFISEFKLILIN